MTTPIQMVVLPPPDPSILKLFAHMSDTVSGLAQQMAQNNHIRSEIHHEGGIEAGSGQIRRSVDKSTAVECRLIYQRLLSVVMHMQFLQLSLAYERMAVTAARVAQQQATV